MAGSRSVNEIQVKVTADARSAIAGLKPLSASLDQLSADAQEADKSLDSIGGAHKISINDQAIADTRREIDRLRQQMRQDIAVDVNADTKAAQVRIAQLQRNLKVLDSEVVTVPVVVTGVEQAEGKLNSMRSSVTGIGTGVKGIGGAIVGSAVGKWLLDGAVGAAEFETNMRGVNAVLGETTQIEVESWIRDNAEALNLSEINAGELARSLTVAAKGFQDAGGDAGDFLINMERITAEVAAFSGKDPSQITEAISGAFRGEFDSLQTAGINLNAARVEQQAYKDGLIGLGGEMTPAIQMQATYNAILEESAPLMGSVARNTDTTKGSMDQLTTSVKNLSSTLGSTLGPTISAVADILNITSDLLDSTIGKYNKWRDEIVAGAQPKDDEKNFIKVLAGDIALLASGSWDKVIDKTVHEAGVLKGAFGQIFLGWGDDVEDVDEKITHAGGSVDWFFDRVSALVDAHVRAAAAAEVHETSIKNLNDRVESTADAFEELMSNLTATNDAMISARSGVYDYEKAVDDLAESLKDSSTFSPDSEEGRKNWDNLVGFAEAASQRVENALTNRGADAAEAIFNSSRDALHRMLTDAGVESGKAWRLVDQVFKKPVNMRIKLNAADVKRINADLEKLRRRRRRIEDEFATQTAGPISADRAERLGAEKDLRLAPIQQQINIDLKGKDEANEELAGLTKDDRGKDRKAQVNVVVPQREIDAANADIDGIIKLRRTAQIQLEIVPPDTPIIGGFPFGQVSPFVPRTSSRGDDRRTTTAAPQRNKIDVSVYMDGRLIDRVPGRVNRRSGRRVA